MTTADIRTLNEAANQHCQHVAWPTVLLVMTTFSLYFALPIMVYLDILPLWLGALLMIFAVYANYTALHEAVHSAVCGSQTHFRWLNEVVGYLAAVPMFIPFSCHRFEHFLHHKNTNKPKSDPDIFCADMTQSPRRWFGVVLDLTAGNYRVYLEQYWPNLGVKQRLIFCLELVAIVGARLVLVALPFLLPNVNESAGLLTTMATIGVMVVLAPLMGVAVLIYLFAFLVHVPHTIVGKYIDTSVYEPPRAIRGVITWLWGFQNYHGVHHAFPRVPWFRYRALFDAHRAELLALGIPTFNFQHGRWRPIKPA